jgi:hypothetical protein
MGYPTAKVVVCCLGLCSSWLLLEDLKVTLVLILVFLTYITPGV